tara:strand:- start:107 stop:262 length:156 start_codon:yes stop_codon:yes gene_type:complete
MDAPSSSSSSFSATTLVVLLLRRYGEGRSVKMKNRKQALSNLKFILLFFTS